MELRPPTIVADGKQHYINQGGMELVVLDAGRQLDRSRRSCRQLYGRQLPDAGRKREQPAPLLACSRFHGMLPQIRFR